MPNLWFIFMTGLVTGGITCMAVQGGLLATTIAQREAVVGQGSSRALPVVSFLWAKLLSHILLGFLLGWLGSFFHLTITAQAILLSVAAVFMIGVALNMLEVHPVFRYFVIAPPRFLTRMIRGQSKQDAVFAPAILGALTIFIPCGTTQAMMALAIATGNPWYGALILGSFVLGTSPLFFILGYSITRIKDVLQGSFVKVAAYSVLIMALWNINGSLALSGSTVTVQSITKNIYCTVTFCEDADVLAAAIPTDTVTIRIRSDGYVADNPVIVAGSRVKLQLVNETGRGCTQAFTIPKLGIQRVVPVGSSETVEFTAPSTPGKLAYTCNMGMYGGILEVVARGT